MVFVGKRTQIGNVWKAKFIGNLGFLIPTAFAHRTFSNLLLGYCLWIMGRLNTILCQHQLFKNHHPTYERREDARYLLTKNAASIPSRGRLPILDFLLSSALIFPFSRVKASDAASPHLLFRSMLSLYGI